MQNTIFIQIASYRDPELLPTIRDCISRAAFPERLTFGIAWQHSQEDEWDTLDEFKHLKNFRILDINSKDAKGVCWARHEIQKLYAGEKYCLQLDSHHRFDKHWDITLVRMLQELQKNGYEKPLLTAYVTSYDPDTERNLSETNIWKQRSKEPWKLNFDRFAPDGVVHISPSGISDYKTRTQPIPARFLSAHFIFTLGQFCTEVPYDPEYYFHGEEISLAVRAFTHGYDLFHPHKTVIWHEYTRNDKVKHWADNDTWLPTDIRAKQKNKKLLGVDMDPEPIDIYGLGIIRSLKEYERYAGLEFKTRKIHEHTLQELHLPIPFSTEDDFQSKLRTFKKYCIDFYKGNLIEDDYDFLVVVLKNKDGEEIYREDAPREEIERMMNSDSKNAFIQIWRKFYSEHEATDWVVWPHSESNGWGTRHEGKL